jgi:hypothetical protein
MEYFVDTFVDKRIGVGLNGFYTVILSTIGTTILTLAILPCMFAPYIAQVALRVMENRTDTVLSVGLLSAVKCTAAHFSSEVGASDTKHLLGHDVVNALLQVGNLFFKTFQQAFGNLAKENTTFATRIEESCFGTAEQFLWQQVKHSVGQLGRGEDFIAA